MKQNKPLTLTEFCIRASEGDWQPYQHLQLIIELLMYTIQGKCNRCMIFVPPGHGKSDLISYYFIVWYLCNYPDNKLLLATHTSSFSEEFGSKARNLLKEVGDTLLPYKIELSQDSKSNKRWNIKGHKGGLQAIGVNSAVLGKRANGLIIDDPSPDYQTAMSKAHQDRLNNWWQTTAKTRLDKDNKHGIKGWVIGLWQRLNQNDLAGQILETEPQIPYNEAIQILRNGGSIPYGHWIVLNLKAICTDKLEDPLHREVGEALWSYKKPITELKTDKQAMGSFRFESVYQGNPLNPEGNLFKREWFKRFDITQDNLLNKNIREHMAKARYWDFSANSINKKTGMLNKGDKACGMLCATDGINLYYLSMKHGNYTANTLVNLFIDTTKQDIGVTVGYEEEPASGSRLMGTMFRKALPGRYLFNERITISKLGRSIVLQAKAEAGQVYIEDKIFNKCVEQLTDFTGEDGKPDDIVDSMTGCQRMLTKERNTIRLA